MSNVELAYQRDMFTGELVDTRSRAQKDADREKDRPHQIEMFRQKDIAQFGVSAHPMMPLSPGRLVLIREDPRTPEEIEHDLQREAESRTIPLFHPDEAEYGTPETNQHPIVVLAIPCERIVIPLEMIYQKDTPRSGGYRVRARQTYVHLRHRR